MMWRFKKRKIQTPDLTKFSYKQRIEEYVCGCGLPVPALDLLHEFLKFVDNHRSIEDIQAHCNGGKAETYLIAYLLDSLELIEHGCSIRIPWLTQNGEALLEALNVAQGYNYDLGVMEDKCA